MSNQKTKTLAQRHIQVQEQSFSGPLPPPDILEHYNSVIPNGAERIMLMAEKQSQHRQELEKAAIGSDIKNSRKGLYFGLIISISGILSGTICIITGHPVSGSILGGGTIVSLVSTFIYGSKSRKEERIQKDKNQP